jgi:ketosteroid isomerase-like protein
MTANLDLVRAIYAAWEHGDFSNGDWADPQIEFVIPDGPAPGRWKGLAEMAHAMHDILSAWEDFRFVADEYRELDGKRVLVFDRNSGRGRSSGAEIGQTRAEGAQLFRVDGGKVTRLVSYWDRDRAFADLGLTTEDG